MKMINENRQLTTLNDLTALLLIIDKAGWMLHSSNSGPLLVAATYYEAREDAQEKCNQWNSIFKSICEGLFKVVRSSSSPGRFKIGTTEKALALRIEKVEGDAQIDQLRSDIFKEFKIAQFLKEKLEADDISMPRPFGTKGTIYQACSHYKINEEFIPFQIIKRGVVFSTDSVLLISISEVNELIAYVEDTQQKETALVL